MPPPQTQQSTDAEKSASSNPPQSCGFKSYQFVQVLMPSALVVLSSFVQPGIGNTTKDSLAPPPPRPHDQGGLELSGPFGPWRSALEGWLQFAT